MSHLTEAQFNAARIRAEETVANLLARLESINVRQEVRERIDRDLGFDMLQNDLANVSYSLSYATLDAFKAIEARANSFLSSLETYVAYSFNLDITDYRTALREAAELLVTSGSDVVNSALGATDDELLKTYVRAAANQTEYNNSEALLAAATELMSRSRTYQKRAAENARKILAGKKTSAVISIAEDAPIAEVINNANLEQHNETVDRAVRNRVLTSIIKIIREQGFIVKKENVEECGDHAKIQAVKPNGEQANFIVHMDGKFMYKFHEYEGLSCEKDISAFEEKFDSIYGIKLEDKKIHWSNPDRIGKMAHQSININRIGG